MNNPNIMEPNEVGRGIETGFKMLTDSSFEPVINAEGIADLKKLLRLLLTGIYTINTQPNQEQLAKQAAAKVGDTLPTVPPEASGGNGSD